MLICLATLPTLLFTFFIVDQERTRALERTRHESQYLVNLIAREHLYQVSGARGLLRWLTDRMKGEPSKTLVQDSKFLESLLAGYPQLANIAILSANGDVVNSAYPVSGEVNMASYGAIERALRSTDIETGGYVIGPIVKRPLLHLAKAVKDRHGKVRWVVFVAIDLGWWKSVAEKIELPSEHKLLIVDRDGTILANSDKDDHQVFPAGSRIPGLSESSRKERAIINTSAPGHPQSFAVAPMEDIPGILVVTALPYAHINEEANATFYRMLGVLLLVTLCTVSSVIFLEEATLLRWLRALLKASQRLGQGDYSVRVPVQSGHGELENMARSFNLMAETLTRRHQELEEAHSRLDKLTRHLQIARESEAQRIARDLHDEVGQVLTSIKMDLARIDSSCDQSCGVPLLTEIKGIRDKLDGMVEFVRRIASDLRPPVLDRMGLVSAVELLARNIERNSHVVIDVESGELNDNLDWLIPITLYRIVQESLTNIIRHSGATEVRIQFDTAGEEIILTVEDNGCGIEHTNEQRETLGIIGMQERARLVNGIFSIKSKPGRGTRVRVAIPRNFSSQ